MLGAVRAGIAGVRVERGWLGQPFRPRKLGDETPVAGVRPAAVRAEHAEPDAVGRWEMMTALRVADVPCGFGDARGRRAVAGERAGREQTGRDDEQHQTTTHQTAGETGGIWASTVRT
jgi:hypothetical protein